MKFSVGSNWDLSLLDGLAGLPVYELFGSLGTTPVGGGRPSFIMSAPNQAQAQTFVAAAHQRGLEFNYLLNSPCMGNMEYDKETHRSLIEHLDWLCEIGVDTVTVTIPYLLQLVKAQYPQLKAKVSVIAHVNTVSLARYFDAMGADEIMLDYMSNRDFEFLKQVRKAVDCDLSLLLNDVCLYQCPYRSYHYNTCGHASQGWHPLEGFYLDYCLINCAIRKLSEPAELIRARWIRPEDIERYEALGYDRFKVSGRRMSTAWLVRATTAYANRRYDGNLIDIVDGATPGIEPDAHSPQYMTLLKGLQSLNAEGFMALGRTFPARPYIDNRGLDGFLDYFEQCDCARQCGSCDYCAQMADQVVIIDQQTTEPYLQILHDAIGDLLTSRVFLGSRETQQNSTVGAHPDLQSKEVPRQSMTWDMLTQQEFDQVISCVPESLRSVARSVILKASEDMASGRGSKLVAREDMVRAFLQYTPDVFRQDMLSGLHSIGVDLRDYA